MESRQEGDIKFSKLDVETRMSKISIYIISDKYFSLESILSHHSPLQSVLTLQYSIIVYLDKVWFKIIIYEFITTIGYSVTQYDQH